MPWTIGRKLLAAFLGVALVTAALGLFSILQLDRVNSASTEIDQNWLPSTQVMGRIDNSIAAFRILELRHNLLTDEAQMAPIEREMLAAQTKVAEAIQAYEPLITSPRERELWRA